MPARAILFLGLSFLVSCSHLNKENKATDRKIASNDVIANHIDDLRSSRSRLPVADQLILKDLDRIASELHYVGVNVAKSDAAVEEKYKVIRAKRIGNTRYDIHPEMAAVYAEGEKALLPVLVRSGQLQDAQMELRRKFSPAVAEPDAPITQELIDAILSLPYGTCQISKGSEKDEYLVQKGEDTIRLVLSLDDASTGLSVYTNEGTEQFFYFSSQHYFDKTIIAGIYQNFSGMGLRMSPETRNLASAYFTGEMVNLNPWQQIQKNMGFRKRNASFNCVEGTTEYIELYL